MLSRWFLFIILFIICISFGCSDDHPTKPAPAETFELKISVVDSSGAPVEGLMVSTWTDTVVLAMEQSVAANSLLAADLEIGSLAFTARRSDPHPYGDVDCDGVPFAISDYQHMLKFLAHMTHTDSHYVYDCVERHGDVVPATKGVTIADFIYLNYRLYWDTIPDGRTLRSGEATYLFDEYMGVLSFPYQTEVQAVLLTYEKDGFFPPEIYGPNNSRTYSNLYGSDSTYSYVMVWSLLGDLRGDVLRGHGKLVSIEGAGDLGRPLHLTRVAHEHRIVSEDPNLSDSTVTFALVHEAYSPARVRIFDMRDRLLEDTVVSRGSWYPVRWKPDSLLNAVYRFEMEVVEAEGLVVRDTAYGVWWSDDPERTGVGATDPDGKLVIGDVRLFPSLFEFPTFLVGDSLPPYLVTPFVFSDSVTIHVRDTSTGEFKGQRFLLTHGRNDVTVVWP